nr:hypothetical protein [Tessaracoccus timonensis]
MTVASALSLDENVPTQRLGTRRQMSLDDIAGQRSDVLLAPLDCL